MPSARLENALEQLVRAELVFRRGTPPDATYTFKHALVQDAAYSTLLRSRRQQLHGRICSYAGTPISGDRSDPARACGAALHERRRR
jgi:predicted ATPase